MLNKLHSAIREQKLLCRGDTVVCAVSGGADSIALLFGLYLLQDRLGIRLTAAHFNHHLRGEESDADEAFVRKFCDDHEIPCFVGGGQVTTGPKGLEAAARDARYRFLTSLEGRIVTAHTADDNAETILMHMLRGSGLRGLGGIPPVSGRMVRPMLGVTRDEVMAFLAEYHLPHREDSSNAGDAFLRNRIRHHVIPLLKAENPALCVNLSAMAARLRQDEACLQDCLPEGLPPVPALRAMPPALRSRCLDRFLKGSGVPEPEQAHLRLAELLVFADKPSASVTLPGGIRVARSYDTLVVLGDELPPSDSPVAVPGVTELPVWNLRVSCSAEDNGGFCVQPVGAVRVRSRMTGDSLRLPGGTKTIKKWMIDRKIPAERRAFVPVLADDRGVLALFGAGPNRDRLSDASSKIYVQWESLNGEEAGGTNGE